MRTKPRHWMASLGVALLVLASHDVPSARAAEDTWLGVYTQELTSGLREGLEYSGDGALITRVVRGSPADRAGLRKGDVIVRIDTRRIDSPAELSRVVRSSRAGENVIVHIMRDGTRKRVNVRLESRPAASPETSEEDFEAPRRDRSDPEAKRKEEGDRENFFWFDTDGEGFSILGMGRGRLGVRVQDLNPDLGEYFGADDGALIVEVVEDTPAEKAGLKAGDVITHVDDRRIDDSSDLIQELRSKEGTVTLTTLRHGERRTVDAELAKGTGTRRFRAQGLRDLDSSTRRQLDRHMRELRVPLREHARDGEELREEVRDLRRELRELRRELDELRRR